MRYSIAIPQANQFATPTALRSMARAAEDLGFDGIWVSDHVIVPTGSDYIPENLVEPLALLAWLASETDHVTLGTSVLILPYRNPVFTAKFLSSVDVLCGGRLAVGVGAGWLEAEFDALGVPFAERGARTDEALAVIRNLWETETSAYDGEFTTYRDVRSFPKAAPGRRGTIPLVVGGNAAVSVRRAAQLGDGWHPINLSPADLGVGVADYRRRCDEAGRSPGPVIMRHMPGGRTEARANGRAPLTGSTREMAADLAAYAEAGLDEMMLSWADRSVDGLIARWRTFMREVASKV
ncbi:MAG: TIGR03619 family F420-dependent LLM class oxidoreductase [Actinomycetota bacterium]|nr:TIGR03619 family F420-dependent LLM class oxidoreductase [Actinomycetota bacterium]